MLSRKAWRAGVGSVESLSYWCLGETGGVDS